MKRLAPLLLTLLLPMLHGTVKPSIEDIEKQLSKPILTADQSLKEVQAFCESRVPAVPGLKEPNAWLKESIRIRREVLDKIVFRGTEGKKWRNAKTKVMWGEVLENLPGYRIRKLRFEILPGWWAPALLYEPEKLSGKVPVVVNVNGHGGAGKALDYKQIRCINQAKRGMLALNVEWIGMGQLRKGVVHYQLAQLDLCGASGLTPFFLNCSRALDLLLEHPNADPDRVAVAGLSGGGWQTIFFSSLDHRVKLANPVAGYSSFKTRARHFSDLGDSEQTPNDLATIADYTHLTAMLSDRALLLTKNAQDKCCFAAPHSLPPLMEAAKPKFALLGRERFLRSHVNHDPGTHNFEKDNRQQLYRMLGDVFYPNNAAYDWKEIPSGNEVKAYDELVVPLPEDNLNFNKIALRLAKDLPRDPFPRRRTTAEGFRRLARSLLEETVHFPQYETSSDILSENKKGDTKVVRHLFHFGKEWSAPATEFIPSETKGAVLMVGDKGRSKLANEVKKALGEGNRVLVLDPFYFGESKIRTHDFLFAILVAAVGERPLGIQASQVASSASWLKEKAGTAVEIRSYGPRSSLFALIATVLEKKAIGSLEAHDSLKSLKEILNNNWGANKYPELFCFGLLEHFDIPLLKSLAQPSKVNLLP
jgi:cephalosporin-C deacetylase-like acetyl esterase